MLILEAPFAGPFGPCVGSLWAVCRSLFSEVSEKKENKNKKKKEKEKKKRKRNKKEKEKIKKEKK